MKNRSRLIVAAALSLAFSYPAFGADPAPQQGNISDEIQALRAKIDQLETKQKAAEQQRKEAEQKLEERLTSDELSRQAVSHDQFIAAEGFTAGYSDNRFVIQSGDGNFVLRPWYHLQVRAVGNERLSHQGLNNEDQFDGGLEIRTLRFGVDGNMFSPDFTYFFNWQTQRTNANSTVTNNGATVGTVSNSAGGVPVLQQAWVKYHIPTTPYYLKFGQMKDPLYHEQIVDTRYQLAAERSIIGDIFTNGDDYTEAATFIYDPNTDIRAEGGVNHGMRSANTNFLSFPDNGSFNQFNYGFVGRVDYKLMGQWSDYNQMSAVGTKERLLVIGAGADYSERGHSGQVVAVVDAMYADPNGLSLFGAILDRYTTHNFGNYIQSATGAVLVTPDPAIANRPTNEPAFMLEAAYILNQHIEPFARYEYMDLKGTAAGSHNSVQAFTVGGNYYFHGHRLKITTQMTWLPKGLPFDDTSNDVLANSNGKSEFVFIGQLQLAL